jgi:hypothetical protein
MELMLPGQEDRVAFLAGPRFGLRVPTCVRVPWTPQTVPKWHTECHGLVTEGARRRCLPSISFLEHSTTPSLHCSEIPCNFTRLLPLYAVEAVGLLAHTPQRKQVNTDMIDRNKTIDSGGVCCSNPVGNMRPKVHSRGREQPACAAGMAVPPCTEPAILILP